MGGSVSQSFSGRLPRELVAVLTAGSRLIRTSVRIYSHPYRLADLVQEDSVSAYTCCPFVSVRNSWIAVWSFSEETRRGTGAPLSLLLPLINRGS
jgi:hypothetical protein